MTTVALPVKPVTRFPWASRTVAVTLCATPATTVAGGSLSDSDAAAPGVTAIVATSCMAPSATVTVWLGVFVRTSPENDRRPFVSAASAGSVGDGSLDANDTVPA